jgi:hypothetical protein
MRITRKLAPVATLRSLLEKCGMKPSLRALPSRQVKVETPQDRSAEAAEEEL